MGGFWRAQRRPGHQPRRHPKHGALWCVIWIERSTKAGASTPATLSIAGLCRARSTTLNEGRGINPGDTRVRGSSRLGSAGPLNEGRGINPGDTGSTGGTTSTARTLNEGRGINPGDTSGGRVSSAACVIAQRRPGHQPRRHVSQPRLSKGGRNAQRRPGHQPRRHSYTLGRALSSLWSTLNEGRGINPGDTRRWRLWWAGWCALNEGRGINPGDTVSRSASTRSRSSRSTKAGASTPATPGVIHSLSACTVMRHRSTKAGASTPATPEITSLVMKSSNATMARSTKAGASTPATL